MGGLRIGIGALAIGLVALMSGCGSSSTTTVVTETTPPPTATTTGSTTSAAGPADCTSSQAFSQVSQTCVNLNTGGGNPCPPGQVPMADQPVCVAGGTTDSGGTGNTGATGATGTTGSGSGGIGATGDSGDSGGAQQ